MSRASHNLPSPAAAATAGEGVAPFDEHGAKVQAMFTDIAPGYDRANRLMSMGIDVRWRRRAVSNLLPPHVDAAGARILDLCAGTLDSSLEIHRRYPDASVVGGDFSAGMLEAGRARLRGDAREKIEAVRMDAHDLPCADAEFDALFCAFGVRNLSDLDKATAEQARALKPGGQLVILEFFRPQRLWTRAFHAAYNHTVLPVVGWACTGNLEAYRYLPRSMSAFRSADEYAQLLRDHGFVDVEIEHLTFGVSACIRARRPLDDGSKESHG